MSRTRGKMIRGTILILLSIASLSAQAGGDYDRFAIEKFEIKAPSTLVIYPKWMPSNEPGHFSKGGVKSIEISYLDWTTPELSFFQSLQLKFFARMNRKLTDKARFEAGINKLLDSFKSGEELFMIQKGYPLIGPDGMVKIGYIVVGKDPDPNSPAPGKDMVEMYGSPSTLGNSFLNP